jgi:hypothetical protein
VVDPADALVTCGLASDGLPERSVVEVRSPIPMVLVVGPERGITVVLLAARTPDVRMACLAASESSVQAVAHPWPLTVHKTAEALDLLDQFIKPERAWDEGLTFHLDRYHQPHDELIDPGRNVTRRLNQRRATDER